jgi:hypothetical protein
MRRETRDQVGTPLLQGAKVGGLLDVIAKVGEPLQRIQEAQDHDFQHLGHLVAAPLPARSTCVIPTTKYSGLLMIAPRHAAKP